MANGRRRTVWCHVIHAFERKFVVRRNAHKAQNKSLIYEVKDKKADNQKHEAFVISLFS